MEHKDLMVFAESLMDWLEDKGVRLTRIDWCDFVQEVHFIGRYDGTWIASNAEEAQFIEQMKQVYMAAKGQAETTAHDPDADQE